MRQAFAAACLIAFVLIALPTVSAQQDEDDDGVSDDGVSSNAQFVQQVSDEYADSGQGAKPSDDQTADEQAPMAGPVAPAQQTLPQLPAAPAQQAAPSEAKITTPANVSGPATVSMVTSLDHFGQQHFAAPAKEQAAVAKEDKKDAKAAVVVDKETKKEAKVAVDAGKDQKATQAAADARNAHIASETAKNAAEVANKVAIHSVHLAGHAKSALKDAHDALHAARVDSVGLSDSQKYDLKKAEAKLKEATKTADYGEVKNAKYVKAKVDNKKLQKLERKMDKIKKEPSKKHENELEKMREEIDDLRKELKTKEGDKTEDDALLQELQDQIKEMEEADKKDDKHTKKSHDEMKAEIERLRTEIKSMETDQGSVTYSIPKQEKEREVAKKVPAKEEKVEEEKEEQVEKYNVNMKPLARDAEQQADEAHDEHDSSEEHEATPVESKGIDIDTAMPYGDLEPFGREDTAQELTENSIMESDKMVDQLERAEVSEEKRSVFRALTRLRGAAITSFDGVARSQTGNIDEYNKIHKWRNTHPLHHLADEESDISKWAFPENAD